MSKLSKESIRALEDRVGDNESYHWIYDLILKDKIAELDLEWAKELEELREKHDVDFWYA